MVATSDAGGVPFDSGSLPVVEGLDVPLKVVTYPVTDALTGLTVARLLTRVGIWEGQIEIHQTWRLVQRAPAAIDPALSGGLQFSLPKGATQARVHDQDPKLFEVVGASVRYLGIIRPKSPVSLRISYALPYEGGSFTLRQLSPLPLEERMTLVPVVPIVRHRPLEGVVLSVSDHGHGQVEQRQDGAETVWVLRAPAAQAGARELTLTISGLPHHSPLPGRLTLVGVLLILLWGGWMLLRPPKTASKLQGRPEPLDPQERARLLRRREALFERLLAMERARSGDDDEAALADRERLRRRLIDVDRRLEGHP